MRRRVALDSLPLFRFRGYIAGMAPVSVRRSPTPGPKQPRAGQQFGANTASEATAMIKSLLYMAPIALVGLVATEAPAATAAWSGGIGRNITATASEGTGVPLVLECQRGGRGGGGGGARAGGGARGGGGGARAGGGARGGGGGARAGGGARGGGGGSWAGAGRGNFSGASANRGNFSGASANRGNFNSANANRGNFN